jgi:excisionase family DNA binding protein
MTHELSSNRSVARASRRSGSSDGVRFFTISQVARLVDVSVRSVRRWIDNGELKAHRFGRSVRIAESDLNDFINRHRH